MASSPVTLTVQVGGHHAIHIRTILSEYNSRVSTHGFQFAVFVGAAHSLRQSARNRTVLVPAEHLEKIICHLFIQDLAPLDLLQGKLRLMIQLGQDCDLDGTGLRENFVLVKKELLPSGEIPDGRPHLAKVRYLISCFLSLATLTLFIRDPPLMAIMATSGTVRCSFL